MKSSDNLNPKSYQLAATYGFCYGVKKAVKGAENLLKNVGNEQKIHMYGAVIHNKQVVNNFKAAGLELINSAEEAADNATVLIRAHGITLPELAILQAKNCKIVDETCGYVKFIQQKIKQFSAKNYAIILAGHHGHPEIASEVSYAPQHCTVVESLEELKSLNLPSGKAVLLAQTTFNHEEFTKISNFLSLHLEETLVFDTICRATVDRQLATSSLAGTVDVMIIIGDRSSSNTKRLLDLSTAVCGAGYLVENAAELLQLKLRGVLAGKRVGIAAGASAPDSIITEVVQVMNENTELMNQEALQEAKQEQEVLAENKATEESSNDVSFTDFIDSIPQLKRGEIIKGVIVRYDQDFVYVDVKDKSEGKIPMSEFVKTPDFDLDKAIADHEEIEIYVRSIRNSEMGKEILLSKARVDFNKYKELLKKAYEEKTPLTVKVVSKVKDGLIASYGGADIYIHRTQIELSPVEDLEPYVGQTMEVIITTYDDSGRRLRVAGSRRNLLAAIRDKQAEAIWESLEVGDVYEGVVRNLTNFGAFVDLGGLDGLIHITELSWNRIRHPKEVLSIGDKVQVYIKDFDREAKRISLGYRKLEDDPYFQLEEKYPIGSIVDGKVARMMSYGAFVNIAPDVDALCHISQIANRRIEKPEDVLKVGQEVQARVLEVNPERRRISISIKSVMNLGEPEGSALAQAKQKEEQDFPSSYRDDDGTGADISIVQTSTNEEA